MTVNNKAILMMVKEELKYGETNELCDGLIVALTAEVELGELLDSIENATSVTDVYEATTDYVAETKRKIADKTITCDSVFKMIQEDQQLERAYKEVYK